MPTSTKNPTVSTNAGTWTTPDNVFATDDARATKVLAADEVSGYVGGKTFAHAVPAGATIDRIAARIEASQTGLGTGAFTTTTGVQFSKDGVSFENSTSAMPSLTGTDAYSTFEMTETGWTVDNVNGAGFEIRCQITEGSGASGITARIDHIESIVEYTSGGAATKMYSFRRRRI